jgi:hypothetical protein
MKYWDAPEFSVEMERKIMSQTVWKCEQLRAGKVYSKTLFNTREEAEQFVSKMSRVEPDIFWRLEAVEARLTWN